MASIS